MDSTTLFLGLLLGSAGFGFFLYGKKQKKFITMLIGIVLSILPYFGLNLVVTLLIGVVLCIAPFIVKA